MKSVPTSTTRARLAGPALVGHGEAVLDGGHARLHRVPRPRLGDAVRRHLQPGAGRLLDHGADVLSGIDVGLVVDHELDDPGPEVDVLAHRLAISSRVSAYCTRVPRGRRRARRRARNCPPKGAMIRPAFTMVGPGTSPCSTACRRSVSAYRPALPRSRTVVKPASSIEAA